MPDFLSIMPVLPQRNNGVLRSLPVNPTLPPAASPTATAGNAYNGPVFADILDRLNNANGFAGEDKFKQGIATLAPPSGTDPAYQTAIDQIRANAGFYGGSAAATAQALAARRGVTGSSIEQFGTQSALDNVNRTAADQEAQIRMQELARRQALQDKTGEAYFNRANQEGTLGQANNSTAAQLTSDEIVSLRNSVFADRNLALQESLGNQQLDIARQNIGASQDIAQQQAQFGLIGSIGSALIPSLFGGIKGGGLFGNGGGGGGIGSIFSGLTSGGGATAVPYAGGGSPASSLFPGGLGQVGTNAPGFFGPGGSIFNSAGTSSIGAGSVLAGLGGYYAGTQAFGATQPGDQAAMNVGGAIGGIGGSIFGPAGSAAGAFIGTGVGKANNRLVAGIDKSLGGTAGSIARYSNPFTGVPAVANKVSSAVKSVFPF